MPKMNKQVFTKQLKQKALEIGFHKVGIVKAEPLEKEGNHLKEWLEKGFNAEMRWMEREPEKRSNPKILFPEAKSMVVLAMNYYTPHEHKNDDSKGKISRYAWGDDYHDVIKEKLWELLGWVQEKVPETKGKVCVDTAPIMDKAWAIRAGLGWLGKHSNVITKEFGSWVFIGEILLSLDLEYETEMVEDHCGTCTACLDACPTNAIIKPFVVDSNACLSYATIELRAPEFPQKISENLDGWLYGCDVCQDVCPWNRFQKPTDEIKFEPRKNNVSADLNEICSLSQEQYAKKFRRSAIKRAKLNGLKRNAKALLNQKAKSNQTSTLEKRDEKFN